MQAYRKRRGPVPLELASLAPRIVDPLGGSHLVVTRVWFATTSLIVVSDPKRIGPARVFQSCGTFESLIYYNRSLVPLFRDAGMSVRYVEAQDGLTHLYPGHLWMVYD